MKHASSSYRNLSSLNDKKRKDSGGNLEGKENGNLIMKGGTVIHKTEEDEIITDYIDG